MQTRYRTNRWGDGDDDCLLTLIFPQIVAASRAIQLCAAEKLIKALWFIFCNLLSPPKRQVFTYLGIPLATGQKPEVHPGELPRKAEVDAGIFLYPKIRGTVDI